MELPSIFFRKPNKEKLEITTPQSSLNFDTDLDVRKIKTFGQPKERKDLSACYICERELEQKFHDEWTVVEKCSDGKISIQR